MQKYIAPTIANSFNCPHCGALSHQAWFKSYADAYEKDEFPWWEPIDDIDELIASRTDIDQDAKQKLTLHYKNLRSREPFLQKAEVYNPDRILNVDFSICYSCRKLAVWVGCRILYPDFSSETIPNEDLPLDIKIDFVEAQKILSISPRGSAALLRLCVQKLCKHLGEKGKNINDDIAALVRKGLDAQVQKALDVVRVIGNDAVHPGQIDLKDDCETANMLFTLVNMIANSLITQPNMINGLFARIPETKRLEISRRDSAK